jgi:RNA polymerase sigma-70 factor (ECF subfamily)
VIGLEKVEWVVDDDSGQGDGFFMDAPVLHVLNEKDDSVWQNHVLELYDTFNISLYRYLRSLGLSKDEAEDVVQETFLRLAGHLRAKGSDGNLRSWIFQVAHNCSMDIHRGNRRNHVAVDPGGERTYEPADPNADPEWTYLQKEKMKRVTAAMLALTPRQRDSILLRAEGLRYGEIASVLSVSEQRAIHLVKRGLMRLAEEL